MNSSSTRKKLDQLLPLVYEELRGCASRALQHERSNHTFQTTELVHETYVRLARLKEIDWTDKLDITRVAVAVMRRVLIDYARGRAASKRDPSNLLLAPPGMDEKQSNDMSEQIDLLALNEALEKLQEFDERKAELVELRYFGGQTIDQTAQIMNISVATVKRDWALAKAWLYREIKGTV